MTFIANLNIAVHLTYWKIEGIIGSFVLHNAIVTASKIAKFQNSISGKVITY